MLGKAGQASTTGCSYHCMTHSHLKACQTGSRGRHACHKQANACAVQVSKETANVMPRMIQHSWHGKGRGCYPLHAASHAVAGTPPTSTGVVVGNAPDRGFVAALSSGVGRRRRTI